jgi:sugar phosphate isomerase/epimerase
MKILARSILIVSLITAVPFTFAADKTGVGKSFKGPVGLQLYSLRADFARDVPGTLDKVKAYGIRDVEVASTYGLTPEKFKELLAARGLRPVSGHFPFERYASEPDVVAREAKALGLRYAGCAWITHEGDFDEKECRTAIAVFNKAGEALAKQGIQFFYHAHGFEFQPYHQGTLLDLLMTETDKKNVHFQMDVLWIVFPGQDPVKLLEKYSGRWELMHLKDLKKGVVTGALTGKTDVANDVVLGTGQVDWPAVLAAARRHGVKYYFIEDESPTAAEQIPQTLKFLEQVKF